MGAGAVVLLGGPRSGYPARVRLPALILPAIALLAGLGAGPGAAAAPKAAAPAGVAPLPPAEVETAEELYAKLDYEQANAVARRIVLERSGLSHEQLIRTYRVLAVTCAVLDKQEQSRDAFFQLLVLDPDYQADPNLGPKVNTPFTEARGSFRSLPTKPGIDVAPSVSTGGGTIRVTTRDPTRAVRRVVVGFRWTSSGDFTVSQVGPAEATVIEVGAAPPGRTRLDFYVQGVDDHDNAVLVAGSPAAPKSAFADTGNAAAGGGGPARRGKEEGGGGTILGSPIFWIVTGAAALGGATALFFALRPEGPPTSAALTPVLRCGADRCN